MKKLTICLVMALATFSAFAQKTFVVAKDGTGDFTTIQAAVDAAAEGESTTIYIKAGTFDELVTVGTRQKQSAKKISLIGEGIDRTVITSANGKKTLPGGKDVRDYATLAVYADDFYAENLTVQNTVGKAGGQALALFVSGDRQTYYRCKIAGYQDTHRSKKNTRSYYQECVLEGAVDYIYAGGTCWFERCTLNSVGNGYITAPEDINAYMLSTDGKTKIWLGFIFNNCTVTLSAAAEKGGVALGRPWNKDLAGAGSLYLNCQLNDAVKPAGWDMMNGSTGANTYFGEYNSMAGTKKAKTSKRLKWSHQLSKADYERLNTWQKVDALYRQSTNTTTAYDPVAVIAAHRQIVTNDYRVVERGKLLAFPTARGFGKFASGGRGGKVVEVTNLNDSGEGSLRWALTEAGKENATIVFRVSGIIELNSDIRARLKNVTIAGQTAPGTGILYRGGKLNLGGSDNVIIRNLRGRLGVQEDPDKTKEQNFIAGGSLGIENAKNIIVDHCCFGWSGEENMTMYDNNFTTVQWCIIHEGLRNAGHGKGDRGYGCQWGGSPATFHHNLLAHNDSRSPRLNGSTNPSQDRNVFMEYVNNVNYNWGRQNSCYGGENEAGELSSHECNFANNYYKAGPARPVEETSYFVEMSAARAKKTLTGPSIWYLDGNVMEGNKAATANNWTAISNKTGFDISAMKSENTVYPSSAYTREAKAMFDNYDTYRTPTESALEAYNHVLDRVGTVNRDDVEKRIIHEVTTGTAKYHGSEFIGKKSGTLQAAKGGMIDTPADCEGYMPYPAATPYTDNDHDGMDDAWEVAHGFDPTNPADRNTVVSQEGYTALEVFLNSLMGENIPIVR